jgi:hypothetical protein
MPMTIIPNNETSTEIEMPVIAVVRRIPNATPCRHSRILKRKYQMQVPSTVPAKRGHFAASRTDTFKNAN